MQTEQENERERERERQREMERERERERESHLRNYFKKEEQAQSNQLTERTTAGV